MGDERQCAWCGTTDCAVWWRIRNLTGHGGGFLCENDHCLDAYQDERERVVRLRARMRRHITWAVQPCHAVQYTFRGSAASR